MILPSWGTTPSQAATIASLIPSGGSYNVEGVTRAAVVPERYSTVCGGQRFGSTVPLAVWPQAVRGCASCRLECLSIPYYLCVKCRKGQLYFLAAGNGVDLYASRVENRSGRRLTEMHMRLWAAQHCAGDLRSHIVDLQFYPRSNSYGSKCRRRDSLGVCAGGGNGKNENR